MPTIIRVGGGAGGKAESKNPAVSTLAEEKILLITENGIPVEYYIGKHGYEPELNGPNRTLLVRKDLHSTLAWNTSGVNAYADSTVDDWLNGDFYNSLSANVREMIGATTFRYTIGNGNFTVSTLERAVFQLSVTELGLSHASANTEGTALPIANTLKVAYLNGSATPQYTRSPSTASNTAAWGLDKNGAVAVYTCSTANGIRPTMTIPSNAKVVGPDNIGRYTLEVDHVPDVYGIARDITAQSPVWTRTDGAMTFSATASVGTVAGASDFDNIYPWSEMKRVTLDSGDVMVRIPKFYYGRYRNGNIERIQISGRADVGLTLHPAFNHAGVEQECIYVGAYKAGIDQSVSSNWKALSKSGVAPMTGGTRQQFRLWTKAKGAGWSLIDISTLSAIQMLYLVEFANNNSQAMIGRGYVDGSAKINTGSCDAVIGLTGRPGSTDGKTDVVYRGIEGLWGNIWEFVDGINWNGSIYVCNDPSKYADDTTSNYTLLTYTGATNWSGVYIKEMGVDTGGNQHIMLPTTAASASETTYLCDAVWTTTGWRVYLYGGDYASGSKVGLFGSYLSVASSGSNATIGSRLIYIPQ